MARKASFSNYIGEKLILSGPVAEYFDITGVPEQALQGREASLARARRNLRRKINANSGSWFDLARQTYYKPLFVTLTFAENIQDMTAANYIYRKFVQQFNYHVFKSKKAVLKYSVVVEFQERGAIHYHALFYNVPYFDLRDMAYLWPHGRSQVRGIDDVKNVGAYVTKYMAKNFDDPRLHGKKAHFSSRNLLKPFIIRDPLLVYEVMDTLQSEDLVFRASLSDNVEYAVYHCGMLRMLNNSRHPHVVSNTFVADVDVIAQGINTGLFDVP